ncbi:hypothetical protein F994_02773 [Acinetobacter bohemicus ANC 3994]|uniref:Carboxypeptidase regulatory-like domain-containing protein n=1 Tax=Acinetobacter bohemicus ANC 3994 TaxID=1217715 RepID=N8NW96_9GAMM|nr:hypothetical protein [Acinetobacter bohemicus]ENU18646.1 hypothetical protein F994_02773 [Acinetobacter bohemicus ANC 3994]
MMLINLQVIPAINANADAILTSDKGLSIKGQVKEESIAIPCRVRLHEKITGRIIADKSTDSNGFFEFDHLNLTTFYAIAYHPISNYNALIFDNLIPK